MLRVPLAIALGLLGLSVAVPGAAQTGSPDRAWQGGEPFCKPRPRPAKPRPRRHRQPTAGELRQMALRDRLRLGPAADRYLRSHPRLSGGVSIEYHPPHDPFVLVRVTHAPRHTLRVLRRLALYPDHLRTTKVAHSLLSLRRVQRRVDFKAHEPDGFHVVGVGVDVLRNRVEIDVITRRTDAESYFRAHYGDAVHARVVATELSSPHCAKLFGYRLADDGVTLTVSYESGGGADFDHLELTELPDRVKVAVVVQQPNGFRTADSRIALQSVILAARLGDRPVIDLVKRKRLPALRE